MVHGQITILYGSETGTAQDVAEQIWKSAKRKGLNCTVLAMNDYNIQTLSSEEMMIFVAATTGQGDPPNNMRVFWKFLLRKNLPLTLLENIKYAVLGLGDSSYQKFNYTAKKLNKRLSQLGAREILSIGLADDQHDLGIDATVYPWIEELWSKVAETFNICLLNNSPMDNEVIEKYNICTLEGNDDPKEITSSVNRDIYEEELSVKDDLKMGTLIQNSRTTSMNHFQDVRLITIRAPNITYEPGDILYVRPKNSKAQVNKFFSIMEENNVPVKKSLRIQVTKKEIEVPYVLKHILTLQEIVEQYWDLSFKPRRSTMQILSLISQNEVEKEKLIEFSQPSGQEELYSYVSRPRRNILEVLADFPYTTSKLNINLLFEIMSSIKPRAFSIASSIMFSENKIQILVAIVEYKTKLLEPRLGLCSTWLASLKPDDNILFWIQKGTFKFMHNKPMIFIGPGTGVAPFRSVLLEKSALQQDLSNCILFFGCRNKEKDYHCKTDFENLSQKNHLNLFCAFSRDQDNKIYVQHIIRDNQKLCWNFLQQDGIIYVAGSSKNMPNNVREEFVNLSKNCGKLSDDDAEVYVKQLETARRYQSETWS